MNEAGFAWSIVTGASGGTGAAVARALSRRHRSLVLVGRDAEKLTAVADDCLAFGAADVRILAADLRDRTAMEHHLAVLLAEAPVDALVACAAVFEGREADDVVESPEAARAVLDLNLTATVDLVHLILPDMIDREQGTIVLVSSLAALVPLPDAPSYSAAAAGLLAFGLALEQSVRERGVSVSTICPGHVEAAAASRHVGPRPGRVDADDVAEAVLRCLGHDRASIVLPFFAGRLARLFPLLPRFLRGFVTQRLRFHVARRGETSPEAEELDGAGSSASPAGEV